MTERRRTSSLNRLRRGLHKRVYHVTPRTFHLMVNAWGLVMGFLAFWTALAFFALPGLHIGRTSVGQQLGPLEDLWNVMYGVAGVLMVYGLVRDRRGVDACGLLMMAAATVINLLAIVLTLGPRAILVVAPLVGVAVGAIARALIITTVVHVRVELPDDQ